MVAEETRVYKRKMYNASAEEDEKDKKEQEKQEEILELQRHMGKLTYYFMPWKREYYIKKIKKLKKIEEELQKREAFENED